MHCYKTLVRPILEYVSTVWDPHHQCDINAIETVQRRSARRICNDFSPFTSASRLLANLGLEPLCARRRKDKAVLFHKIFHRKTPLNLPDAVRPVTRRNRGHENKLTLPRTNTEAHLHSFFPSSVRIWNSLPPEAAETLCIETFSRIVSCVLKS